MFKPTWLLKSVYHLTIENLKTYNICGLLIDLDNTLVAWNNPFGDEKLHIWLEEMQKNNIKVVIISNNTTKRVSKIAEKLKVPFVANAKKPTKYGIKKAVEKLQLPKENIVMIGDQLFTDILGGYRFGLKTILVKPLIESDLLGTQVSRILERFYMKKYKKKYHLEWRNSIGE